MKSINRSSITSIKNIFEFSLFIAQCDGTRITNVEPKHFKFAESNGEIHCQKCGYSESTDELLKKHNCDDYNFFKLYRFVLCDKCKYFSVWYKEHLDHLEKCNGGGSSSDSLLNQKWRKTDIFENIITIEEVENVLRTFWSTQWEV